MTTCIFMCMICVSLFTSTISITLLISLPASDIFPAIATMAMAARSFAAALKKNGILVIDYLNREQVLENLVPEETVQRGSYTFNISRKLERNHILKKIEFTDADNKLRHYTESVAAFSLSDFIQIFKQAGLSLTGTFGDYRLGAYDPLTSPRMIMVFKK